MSEALAQTGGAAAPATGPGMILSFAPFIVIFVLFYFLLMRPQQQRAKQRKETIDQLKKGERVMTSGGMIGTVVNLSADTLTLQVAEGVRIKVRRSYVEEVIVTPETPEGEK
jgi:preprotein translocase subunit YajC